MNDKWILPLADPRADLERVGGKGASLARLSRAGLPVPDGFHIATAAYRFFVAANDLQAGIQEALAGVDVNRPSTLESASAAIGQLFAQASMPPELAEAILQAYRTLPAGIPAAAGGPPPDLKGDLEHSPQEEGVPVAVRSSATAEDLPEASFAGQQETYLNIQGADQVLEAVRKCWASLWTARAIGYRARQGIGAEGVALAVVVQRLIPAEAAGILFTANPLNGRRDEALINAAWGLGEAVVGGAVTPDTLVVDKRTGQLVHRETAEKRVMTVRVDGATQEQPVPVRHQNTPVLSDEQAAELAGYGSRIEALYGMPVDIEWALADGKISIVQARPITALPEPELPPPAEWPLPNPQAMYSRSSLAEHLPNPVSPLFATLGLRMANQGSAEILRYLGTELPASADYGYRTINGYVYLSIRFDLKTTWAVVKMSLSQMGRVLSRGTERWRQAYQALAEVVSRWEARPAADLTPSELLEGVRQVMTEAVRYYTVIQSGTLPSATVSEVLLTRLYKLVKRMGDPEATALLFGFETAALRAEKSLFDLAQWVKTRPSLQDYILRTPAGSLASDLRGEQLPQAVTAEDWAGWQAGFQEHLDRFGNTSYEFDFMNPTPAETPETLLEAVKAYIEGRGSSPYERQREAVERRQQLEREILSRPMLIPKGWFRKALKWAQEAGPAREDSIAGMGMGHPVIRRLLAELGARFAQAGAIRSAEDIYWLVEAEVEKLAAGLERGEPLPELQERVEQRQAEWRAQRKAIPPVVLPEGSRWAKLAPGGVVRLEESESGATLTGLGTSPGRVTAPARVLFSPDDFGKMMPGDVLVAVTTTPAWTPLFALASAVVTDIGGPLSHSSIVAREYGIPAVMATGVATRRIRDGQIVTVDGSAGTVSLQS